MSHLFRQLNSRSRFGRQLILVATSLSYICPYCLSWPSGGWRVLVEWYIWPCISKQHKPHLGTCTGINSGVLCIVKQCCVLYIAHVQLYIIEGDQAIITHMNTAPNSQCLHSVMETINSVMQEHSPYARAFKQMHTIEQEDKHTTELDREPQILQAWTQLQKMQ